MYGRLLPLVFGEASPGALCSPTLAHYRGRLEDARIAVNAVPLIAHNNVRCMAMGMAERAPTASELAVMRELVARGMDEGAFGLSTGLVYPPGAYAQTDELVALAEAIAPHGGVYATHMRNEGPRLVESVAEAIAIGERARVAVQISHHKAAGRPNWGKVRTTLGMVDAAAARGLDVHSDVYPYTAGSTVLSTLFVPLWAFAGSIDAMLERLRDPVIRAQIVKGAQDMQLSFVELPRALSWIPRRALLAAVSFVLGRTIVISSVKRQHRYEGMRLAALARERKKPLHEAVLDLLIEEDVAVTAIAHVMSEDDVRMVLVHPRTMVGTDGLPTREG
jgi:N-acyl-D-aspartate/D-glutamate deacylase